MTQEEKDNLKEGVDAVLHALGIFASQTLLRHATELKAKIDADLLFHHSLANFFSEAGGCIGDMSLNR